MSVNERADGARRGARWFEGESTGAEMVEGRRGVGNDVEGGEGCGGGGNSYHLSAAG